MSAAGETRRVAGLDSIRFVCALWVVFGHFGFFPLTDGIDRSNLFGLLVYHAYGNVVSGPAAVIVFFVISGFCIHYPYRDAERVPLKAYYLRRYFRILVPMGVAIALGAPLDWDLTRLNDSILWSLLAEEIYYFLYPALLRLRRMSSWPLMIAGAYIASFLVVLQDPTAGNYPSYGPYLNWLLGLPCWLLGCQLAEKPRLEAPSAAVIWRWRFGIWWLSWLCSALRFHTPLTYPWTLNAFAFVVSLWLLREIAWAAVHPPPALLERAGRFSYSLYLTHLHAHAVYVLVGVPMLGVVFDWGLRTTFIVAFCYVFYRLVEKPSHDFARRLGAWALRQRAEAVAAAASSSHSTGQATGL